MKKYLVFDTETTGFVLDHQPPEHPMQPHLLQLGAVLLEAESARGLLLNPPKVLEEMEAIFHHQGLAEVPAAASKVHGVTTARMRAEGKPPRQTMERFDAMVRQAGRVLAFNMAFDEAVILTAYHRVGATGQAFKRAWKGCLMQSATESCGILRPGASRAETEGDRFKYPSLVEAYKALVDVAGFVGAHGALADARAAVAVLMALLHLDAEIIYERPIAPTAAKAAALSVDMARLDAILVTAGENSAALSSWEQAFVDDFVERREKYKDSTRISPKQWVILERIEGKLTGEG